jgi:peptide/nickel transport system permease protein
VHRYVARRIASSIVVLMGIVVLTFVIARLVPGDPAVSWAGPRATAAQVAATRHELGLDRPLWVKIWTYLKGTLSGDWGTSIHTRQPVLQDLLDRVPASLELVIAALALAVLTGIVLGLIAARFAGRLVDHVIRALSVISVSMPVFWLALILQLVFFQKLGWLPVAGEYDAGLTYAHPLTHVTGAPIIDALVTGNFVVFGSAVSHLILPAMVVAAYPVGVIARMVRASVLDVAEETHLQLARALGFSERSVLSRFALRLGWSPVVQVVALVFAYSLVNTFLVEAVFDWPGLGSYAADAIGSHDTPAIVGITLFIGIVYVLLNLVVDIVQAGLDPRVRLR